MSDFLDELARTMVRPMPRSRVLRLIGGVFAGMAVPAATARAAPSTHNCPQLGMVLCQCPSINGLFFKLCCWSNEACTCDIPHQATCCHKPKVWDGSKCVEDCAGGQTKCGERCCDASEYCCERFFSAKAPHCCDYEEAEKDAWKDSEVASILLVIALGAAAVFTGGLAAIALAGLATGAGLGGFFSKIAGDDPPDPRYKELFRPRVPRVAPVPREGLSPAAAQALDRVIANRLRSGAYGLAWIRSIEKAQGAERARDKTWAKRQRKAAAGYAREAARTLERDKSLSTVALRELELGGFVDTGVTLAQARQWQQRVRQQGLPAETTRALRAAGGDEARIAAYRTAVSRLDPNLVAGVGVFGNLTDQRLAGANAKMVEALRESARTLVKA